MIRRKGNMLMAIGSHPCSENLHFAELGLSYRSVTILSGYRYFIIASLKLNLLVFQEN